MRPSRRRASANLHVPVEQTTLLYKESEFLRRPRGPQPGTSSELFHLGLGETTRHPVAGECGVSW
jgi:hypothetical protein